MATNSKSGVRVHLSVPASPIDECTVDIRNTDRKRLVFTEDEAIDLYSELWPVLAKIMRRRTNSAENK